MVIIFNDTSSSEPQTVIDTKYLLIELIGTELKVTYNHQSKDLDNQPQEKTFANVDIKQRYTLKIVQDADYKDIYVTFDKYEKFDESKMNVHIFDTVPLHSCNYSSGNEFFIACNRMKQNYLKGLHWKYFI